MQQPTKEEKQLMRTLPPLPLSKTSSSSSLIGMNYFRSNNNIQFVEPIDQYKHLENNQTLFIIPSFNTLNAPKLYLPLGIHQLNQQRAWQSVSNSPEFQFQNVLNYSPFLLQRNLCSNNNNNKINTAYQQQNLHIPLQQQGFQESKSSLMYPEGQQTPTTAYSAQCITPVNHVSDSKFHEQQDSKIEENKLVENSTKVLIDLGKNLHQNSYSHEETNKLQIQDNSQKVKAKSVANDFILGQQLPVVKQEVVRFQKERSFKVEQQLFQNATQLQQIIEEIPETKNKPIIWSKAKKSITKSNRGSKYRGISKNGKKWQVQLLGSLKTRYIGSIASEVGAAKIYDFFSIMTNGLKAKTNFNYNKVELLTMINLFLEGEDFNKNLLIQRLSNE